MPPFIWGGGSGVPVICFSWFYVLYMNLVMGGFYILAKNAILKASASFWFNQLRTFSFYYKLLTLVVR